MIAINETLRVLPPEAIQEVVDFAEFLAQKYKKKLPKTEQSKNEILNFAGSWKDMSETDFQGFISDVYERRKESTTRRREF